MQKGDKAKDLINGGIVEINSYNNGLYTVRNSKGQLVKIHEEFLEPMEEVEEQYEEPYIKQDYNDYDNYEYQEPIQSNKINMSKYTNYIIAIVLITILAILALNNGKILNKTDIDIISDKNRQLQNQIQEEFLNQKELKTKIKELQEELRTSIEKVNKADTEFNTNRKEIYKKINE